MLWQASCGENEPVFPWENSLFGTCGWLLVGKVKQFSHGDRWLASLGESEAVFPWENPPGGTSGWFFLGKVKQFSHGKIPWLGQGSVQQQ